MYTTTLSKNTYQKSSSNKDLALLRLFLFYFVLFFKVLMKHCWTKGHSCRTCHFVKTHRNVHPVVLTAWISLCPRGHSIYWDIYLLPCFNKNIVKTLLQCLSPSILSLFKEEVVCKWYLLNVLFLTFSDTFMLVSWA